MNLLALDTSTDRLSLGVQHGKRQWTYEGAGGRAASATLIPAILRLLDEAGLALAGLDAIVFGRGPGSFTGLRVACSVVQGLAWGADVPVLPLDTLLAVAETARAAHGCDHVLAMLDARMDQVYVAPWIWRAEMGWALAGGTAVSSPEDLVLPTTEPGTPWAIAGNAWDGYGARFPAALRALPHYEAWPRAAALLRVAQERIAAGATVPAAQALPLYVRNKVARTIVERAAATGT